MRVLPKMSAVLLAVIFTLALANVANAQVIVDPVVVSERNDGGWVYWLAIALAVLGLMMLIFLTIQYMRYAPRFSSDEEGLKLVRADRVRLGRELPRRNVDLSQASPVIAAPPAVPSATPELAAATRMPAPTETAASAPGPTAAPAQAPPADVPAAVPAQPAQAETPAGQGPAAETPAAEAPAAEAPAAEAPAAAAAAPPAAPAAAEERQEVTMDQEAYEAALQELLDSGTDRRIAEGRARRAGMIAARKKATGSA